MGVQNRISPVSSNGQAVVCVGAPLAAAAEQRTGSLTRLQGDFLWVDYCLLFTMMLMLPFA